MKALAGLLTLLVAAALLLAPLPAQDKAEDKKDDKAAAKKDDAKKDDAKKDDEKKDVKKDEDKKDEKKPEKKTSTSKKAKPVDPAEEKIMKETFVMRARIAQTNAESGTGVTVELPYSYPPKLLAAQIWFKQQLQLGNRSYEVLNQYKMKLSNARQIEIKTAEAMKVRTMVPPIEYDIKGNLKRWTPKEIAALRGASRLPGFPAQFDSVRGGQIVDLYVAKSPQPKRGAAAGKDAKKKAADDDESLEEYPRPEVLMIVVVMEAPMR